MDRYGRGSDRPFWLEAQNGGYYVCDRIKGKREIEVLSAGIFGGIQPEKLKDIPGLTADGLFQRFAPIGMAAANDERDDPVDPHILDSFDALVADIGRIPPVTFSFDDEARALYLKFSNDMRHAAETVIPSPAFGTFVGKQARTAGAIALLLHIVDVSQTYDLNYSPIPAATFLKAQRIVETFLLPHAELFYGSTAVDGFDKVLSVAGAIIKAADDGVRGITARELARRSRAIRELQSDISKIRLVLTPFICNGWLTPASLLPTNNIWIVHPELAGKFKVEVAQQVRIHQEMQRRMHGEAAE